RRNDADRNAGLRGISEDRNGSLFPYAGALRIFMVRAARRAGGSLRRKIRRAGKLTGTRADRRMGGAAGILGSRDFRGAGAAVLPAIPTLVWQQDSQYSCDARYGLAQLAGFPGGAGAARSGVSSGRHGDLLGSTFDGHGRGGRRGSDHEPRRDSVPGPKGSGNGRVI